MKKLKLKTIKCRICGNEETPSKWTNCEEMIEHQMCFECNFWREKLDKDFKREPHTWAVIKGTHYYLEPKIDGAFKGFGGTRFRIRFKDGFETICENLWCQGNVPEGYWRKKFPDNAEFKE